MSNRKSFQIQNANINSIDDGNNNNRRYNSNVALLTVASEDSALSILKQEKWSNVLFHCCFLQWPRYDKSSEKKPYYGVAMYIIAMTASLVSLIGAFSSSVYIMTTYPDKLLTVTTGLDCSCSLIMELASYVSLIHHRKRLLLPLGPGDSPYYHDIAPRCLIYFAVFQFMMMIGAILLVNLQISSPVMILLFLFMLWIIQWVMVSGLAISMYFVIADARISHALVRDLVALAEVELLTVEKLSEVRSSIKERSNNSAIANTVLGVIAAINSVVLLAAVVCLRVVINGSGGRPLTNYLNFPAGEALTVIALLAKEVFYLGIILLEIAKVNDAADILMDMLTKSTWSNESKELLRLRLFVNLYGDPIAFNLCGTRPQRDNVLLQIGGYIFSIVVAFLQLIFSNQIDEAIGYAI